METAARSRLAEQSERSSVYTLSSFCLTPLEEASTGCPGTGNQLGGVNVVCHRGKLLSCAVGSGGGAIEWTEVLV